MRLASIDWFLIIGYLVVSIGIGVAYFRKARGSNEEYFLSGRRFPWWVVGTSMVATTFSADSPLGVTEFIRQYGVWQNWYWWSSVPASLLAIFLFSRLWRRAEVLTENELIELRYSGKPAAFLRAFKALFFAVFYNLVVMGWVLSAMTSILSVLLDVDQTVALWVCALVAVLYSLISGFSGVVVTDVIQFFIATGGAYALAFICVRELGGMEVMLSKIEPSHLSFVPPIPSSDENFLLSPLFKIIIFMVMVWWCRFNVDGGGYIVQRMSSAKNEAHSLWGTLWFYFLYYVVRAWPWIIVALASLVAFPDITAEGLGDKAAYPMMVREYLGPGLKGLLVVSFLAAFMSTIDTHLNWGASYLVHDIYARFLRPDADEKHYVRVSQSATLILMILAALVASQMGDISTAWQFLLSTGAGAGLILALRWFYWRISAWSELTAMAGSVSFSLALELLAVWQHRGESTTLFAHLPTLFGVPLEYHLKLLIIVPSTLLLTALVTFCTEPESPETLKRFYAKVGPGGWWKEEHKTDSELKPVTEGLTTRLLFGGMFLWGGIFAVGFLFLGFMVKGVVAALFSVTGLLALLRILRAENPLT